MKLSELTIEILKNFATLNQSLQFRAGSLLTTITPNKTLFASATVVESFPSDFALYDLNKLLAKLSLYRESELTFESDRILFKSTDGRRNDYIKYSSPKVITAPDPTRKIALDAPEHEFLLSAEDLLWQRKSAGISGSPYMIFHGDGEHVFIRSHDVKDDSSDLSSTEIAKTNSKFTYVIKIEHWKFLDGNYRVKLKKGMAKFENTEKPVEYFVAIEDGLSTY
jgi:hypothetical protein